MHTFILPKYDGTKYHITGKAVLPVYQSDTLPANYYPTAASVIELASGELVLYVHAKPAYYMSNTYKEVNRVYRDAGNMSAESICDALGKDYNVSRVFNALGVQTVEEIK